MKVKRSFESQLVNVSLFASIPPFILLIVVMIYADISLPLTLLVTLLGSLCIVMCHVYIHQKSAHQFRNLTNLLDAMISEDYTLRARPSHGDKALNELVDSINMLSKRLNDQHIKTTESQLLVNTVIQHIDVAIVALNADNKPVLINPAAQKLLHLNADPFSAEHLSNEYLSNQIASPDSSTEQSRSQLHQLEQLKQLGQLETKENSVIPLTFGNQQGKFNVHVEAFREAGKPHKLFFITDVRDMLRHEERNAWQSLVRVFSHEINNSLAPISSISQTLKRSLTLKKKDALNEDNLIEGLSIISQRAQNLTGFVNSYKQLSHLPKPKVQRVSLLNLLEKVVLLYKISPEQHIKVALSPCEETVLSIDPIQFEQVLINLTKNAVESMDSADSKGDINISWQTTQSLFTLTIADTGLGLKNMDNLFVPFYSTKKQGSGIGLVLCRQIIEAHGGQLKLVNRQDTKGCEAIIELPIDN